MRPRVFLSHSSKDVATVSLIKGQAMAAGVDVYLAEHDFRAGDRLAAKIMGEIGDSDAVVVLLTNNSTVAAFVQQEIGVALKAGIPIIPLVQKGVDHAQLAMLKGVEYVGFDPDHPEAALKGLTASLVRLTERIRQEEGRPAGGEGSHRRSAACWSRRLHPYHFGVIPNRLEPREPWARSMPPGTVRSFRDEAGWICVRMAQRALR